MIILKTINEIAYGPQILVKIKKTIKMPRQYFQEKYQMELLETIHTHTHTHIFMKETEHDIGGFDSN